MVFFFLQSHPADSFEPGTHRVLSEKAVSASKLDNFLKTELTFAEGIATKLFGNSITELVGNGSVEEDDSPRFCNHFHNPLSNWIAAGLQFPAPFLCETRNHSSILWGQRQDPSLQPSEASFTWQDARDKYFDGLTALTEDERKRFLSKTFITLGHFIHLVQDAANPAHTRNDPHPIVKGLEGFVEGLRNNNAALFANLTNSSRGFSPFILDATPHSLAPSVVAYTIDRTDNDVVAAVPSAGDDQGLAEYSNANFLSSDTKFKDFTFPREEGLGPFFLGTEPLGLNTRLYRGKVTDGEEVEHFVATSSLFELLVTQGASALGYVLDRRVFEDYAAKLLPRAIGYSAGLIDYFFRGRMTVTVSENQPPPTNNKFTQVRVNVANATPAADWPGNAETGDGEFVAVALSNDQVLGVSPQNGSIMNTLTRAPQELFFDFSHSPLPSDARDLFIQVVYRGPLGLEDDAVAVGGTLLNVPIEVEFVIPIFNGIEWAATADEVTDPHLLPEGHRMIAGEPTLFWASDISISPTLITGIRLYNVDSDIYPAPDAMGDVCGVGPLPVGGSAQADTVTQRVLLDGEVVAESTGNIDNWETSGKRYYTPGGFFAVNRLASHVRIEVIMTGVHYFIRCGPPDTPIIDGGAGFPLDGAAYSAIFWSGSQLGHMARIFHESGLILTEPPPGN